MTMRKLLLCFWLMLCPILWAQQDSIALREVVVADVNWKTFSQSQQIFAISDSTVARSGSSLVAVLQQNSAIYFKENGFGMVASPSFRGTTAQQTAVVWNGININSQLNGQTDFNTISVANVDEIGVRSGGGSVLYGSSAIGGSIHLNDVLLFKDHFDNQVTLGYGSFATTRAAYKLQAGSSKWSVKAAVSRVDAENDYPYQWRSTKGHNRNGQFYNTAFDVAAGYKINSHHSLRFYTQTFDSERHFSASVGADARSKYRDLTSRNLLEWEAVYGRFKSKTAVAFFSEGYQYFAESNSDNFTTGKAETALARYTIDWTPMRSVQISAVVDASQTTGWGTDLEVQKRNIGSGALMLRWAISNVLKAEGSLRKETTNAYESPLLFSGGLHWQAGKQYAVRGNFSRNFRMPTFNDLYWDGSGNPNLKPESGYQAEMGQEFQWGGFTFAATVYYTKVQDMLRWIPGANGLWRPQNVAEVKAYGVESQAGFQKKWGRHALQFSAHYNYVVSHDDTSKLQSIYVPLHKGTASVSYYFWRFGIWYQQVYNGLVYTSTDHAYTVNAYPLSNSGISFKMGKRNPVALGFRANNIFNQSYESVSRRPMPGTHYNLDLTFKF